MVHSGCSGAMFLQFFFATCTLVAQLWLRLDEKSAKCKQAIRVDSVRNDQNTSDPGVTNKGAPCFWDALISYEIWPSCARFCVLSFLSPSGCS